MKFIIGNIYKGIGKILEGITGVIIYILDIIVTLIDSVKKLLSIFATLLIFVILNPFLFATLLFSPIFLTTIVILFIVPFLGKSAISFLRYVQYIMTEYFYDRADYYLLGKQTSKHSFSEYSDEYIRKKNEEQRRESERRAREQQRMWEEMFRNYYEQARRQQGPYGDYNRGTGGYTQGGPYMGGGYYNPTNDFIKKYEESCAVLGLSPTTDIYEIKLAYRKMAKKYHPDINKSPDATERFQKINEANEFLSEANVQRYAQLKKAAN